MLSEQQVSEYLEAYQSKDILRQNSPSGKSNKNSKQLAIYMVPK